MNTPTTFSQSLSFFHHHSLLLGLLFLLLSAIGQAADLTFTPNAPIVEQGKQITLSVSGTSGEVTWTVAKGQIQGTGAQVTYVAPAQVGLDVVTVLDNEGNFASVKVVITPPNDFSLEKANWEVFASRNTVTTLALSEDSKTLWVGTSGGLEKRDAQTGKIQQVFINTNSLPSNYVFSLLSDGQGGVWIGTDAGLAHRSGQDKWIVYNTENSGLPDNSVQSLLSDGQGGLWIGTSDGGLAHRSGGNDWTVYNTKSSGIPSNHVRSLIGDSQGGLWIGTKDAGLVHRSGQEKWTVYNTENSDLPSNEVNALLSDGQGGLWLGTEDSGLVYLNSQAEWTVYNPDNSDLPNHTVESLLRDGQGGIWIGTWGGLAHRDEQGEWTVDFQGRLFPSLLDDGQGGLWIGTGGSGLVRRNEQGEWIVPDDSDDSGLPANAITSLIDDGQSGLWIGTILGGLAHRTKQRDNWTIYRLGGGWISSLLNDGYNGLWIGSGQGGLAHFSEQEDVFTVYNTENSELPTNEVYTLIDSGRDGLWIGTSGGLAHRSKDDEWTIYNSENSKLPVNWVNFLLNDGQDGLWVGTWGGGLAHRSKQDEWTVHNTQNSGLSSDDITALLSDGQGGLWVGTWGLVHYNAQGQWQVFKTDNSDLPTNEVYALLSDSQGGIWVGTDGGLVHYPAQGKWTVFNTENSGLPDNGVTTLLSDNQDGLWIGTDDSGLAHLTFTQKTALCQTTDASTCENLQANKRAAILIAGGGADSTNTLWDTTESITNYLYKVFNKRGFDNDEIYYLSPKAWADFNGDGLDDRIVDAPKPERPLTPEDVRLALEWAKGLGKLDQPLYLFFVDHGGTEKFQLSKLEYLEVTTLKTWLDDYQTVTGNQVMMVIDACHSGQLLESLKAPNRAIISSTGDGLAYFERTDKRGFSRFFATGLLKGMNFWEAFGYAGGEQTKLLGDMSKLATLSSGSSSEIGQVPRFDDGSDDGQWLKQIYLNGSFVAGDLTLEVENQIPATTLTVSQPITLQAKATLAQGTVKRVWAVIRPPAIAQILDTSGTPILAFPRLNLGASPETPDVWQATWNEAVYNGNYLITFYAEDNEKNIASSEQDTVLTVTGGIDPPTQAQVQIHIEKDRYQRGEVFKATLTEELGWGYDLYAAVRFPDEQNFMTLKNTNELRPLNEAKPWYAPRKPHSPLTLFELTLPADLPTGKYCLFGILSPEQNDVFETLAKGLWVMDSQCFEIF